VLAVAGLLSGRRATTHWLYLEQLREMGCQPVQERVVADGKFITAAGVSAGIDMALTLVAETSDRRLAEAIQPAIEYDPQPPFDSGSPSSASPESVELVTGLATTRDSWLAGRLNRD
jgi:transcriptional regulator GlxA family with amidase domain